MRIVAAIVLLTIAVLLVVPSAYVVAIGLVLIAAELVRTRRRDPRD